jgi:hypothetical protein
MKKGNMDALHVAYGPKKGVFYFGVIQAKKMYFKRGFDELVDRTRNFQAPHPTSLKATDGLLVET